MLSVRFEETGEALVVTPLARRLDAAAAPDLVALAGGWVRDRRLVVISLVHVASADASGLAALVALLQRMPPGGALRLAHANDRIRSLLASMLLDDLLPAADDAGTVLRT
jgi:anti-anti-sigma regulatory factor